MDRASATEVVDSGSIPGRVKPKTIKFGIHLKQGSFKFSNLRVSVKPLSCVIDRWQLDLKTKSSLRCLLAKATWWMNCNKLHSNFKNVAKYCIFLNRNRDYYFFYFWTFCLASIWGRLLFFYMNIFVLRLVPSGHSDLSTISNTKRNSKLAAILCSLL